MVLRFQAIIFDFDYTLADSSRGVVECINYALDALDLPTVSAEKACETIGLSLTDTFLQLTGTDARSDTFTRLFIAHADKVMVDSTVLLDSVPQTIRNLRRRGVDMGIVSTKFRRRIQSILSREQLLDHFDVIIGGEDVSNHKPDPEGVYLAIKRLGSLPSNTVYVGDSLVDAETAWRAGLPFFAILSGLTLRSAFDGYNVYQIIDRISDLPRWIHPGYTGRAEP